MVPLHLSTLLWYSDPAANVFKFGIELQLALFPFKYKFVVVEGEEAAE